LAEKDANSECVEQKLENLRQFPTRNIVFSLSRSLVIFAIPKRERKKAKKKKTKKKKKKTGGEKRLNFSSTLD